jgi:hypothetical protein
MSWYVNRLSKQDWRAFFMGKDGGKQKILKLSLKLRGGEGLLKKRVDSGKGKNRKQNNG